MNERDQNNDMKSNGTNETGRDAELREPITTEDAGSNAAIGNESGSGEAELIAERERLRSEATDWQDKYLRKLAEFDNYRKRTRQESEMLGQMVAESLISALLPIMDDFDRMLSNLADEDDPYRKGMELIRSKIWAFFESRGVAQCDCVGKPFDPNEHDALLMKATPDFPPGTVLEVITPGYRMGDRVIRHAQVIVSAEANAESNDA